MEEMVEVREMLGASLRSQESPDEIVKVCRLNHFSHTELLSLKLSLYST